MNYLYLCVDLGAMVVPFIFSFHKRIQFHRHFGAAFLSILLVAIGFIAWDVWYTALGVWGFNSQYITGLHLANLPVEEVMFFVCIPFSCLFTYFVLARTIFKNASLHFARHICGGVGLLVAILGIYYHHKYYSFSAFFLCGMALMLFARYGRQVSQFVLGYLVLLVPFFITNGILTGTGLERPVVWYNDAENVGIRALTIPVEDFFYGMLLILLNIVLFGLFSKNKS